MLGAAPGRIIAGKYKLERLLAQGGMGMVWAAEHLDLRAKVAIKLVIPDHTDDPTVMSRFVREARAAASLKSSHVVQIHDYGVADGLAYIAMELLEGESLHEKLKRESRLSPALTATVITHVARAMTKAHDARLVHRDLKPANVFLIQDDEEVTAKVLDFGIAKIRPHTAGPVSSHTESGAILGSPFYLSPEQARGQSDVDYRSDLWAMGVMAFQCLLGERPFYGTSMGEIILSICSDPIIVPSRLGPVPQGFDAWFARAVHRDRKQRFQSAKHLAESLRQLLNPAGSSMTSDPPAAGRATPADLESEATVLSPREGLAAASTMAVNEVGGSTTGATSAEKSAEATNNPKRVAGILAAVAVTLIGITAWLSARPSVTSADSDASAAAGSASVGPAGRSMASSAPARTAPPVSVVPDVSPAPSASVEPAPPAARPPAVKASRPAPRKVSQAKPKPNSKPDTKAKKSLLDQRF